MMEDRYVEFDLPNGVGGLATMMASKGIQQRIKELSSLHNFTYKAHQRNYKLRVFFDTEENITLFFLIWQPSKYDKMPVLKYV